MTPWHGLVKVQRQLNGSRRGVLIRSQDGNVFQLRPVDDGLLARFAERDVFYAQAVIRRPEANGHGLNGLVELGDEVAPPEQWDIP